MLYLPVIALFLLTNQISAAPKAAVAHILGGHIIPINDVPWQAQVNLYFALHCGGTIIHPEYVLTAAHCTNRKEKSTLSVRAGASFFGRGGVLVGIKEVHQHPQYDPETTDYDLSILRLDKSLNFGATINKVRLPAGTYKPSTGQNVLTSGWGAIDQNATIFKNELRAVTVRVVDDATCKRQYGSTRITPRMLCAGVAAGGRDACSGDSGGPLVLENDDLLIGITSWGFKCGLSGYPGVYTRVSAFRDYIKQITLI